MKWIDPKITPPEEGKMYLIIAEINNVNVAAFVTTEYRLLWNDANNKREKDLRYMYFSSLYSQCRTKAVRLDGKKTSEYKDRTDNKSRYFIETIPSEYRVQNAMAYIEVKDLELNWMALPEAPKDEQ